MEGPWAGCIPCTVLPMHGTPSALIDYKVPIIEKRKSYAIYGKFGYLAHWEAVDARSTVCGVSFVYLVLFIFVDYANSA